MTYSPSYYQPSVLELARQGNFRAIGYWMNSLLAPQGIHIQTAVSRSGCLKIMVNFPRSSHPQACMGVRKSLVRHICYRLWTLNSRSIREVQIMGRIAGQRDVLWRQPVRIASPASKGLTARHPSAPGLGRRERSEQFRVLRSFLVNRLAIAGFIFCYWVLYLESTGHQTAEQPSVAASPRQELVQPIQTEAPEKQEKTAIARRPQAQNTVFTVPAQFQGQIVYEATPPANAEKVVALTFDDGPWENTTEQILDILRQNNIKSTFYFVGKAIQSNPAVAKKVFEEGHAIGNHTWQHPMENLDTATAAQELGNSARLIYEATGGVRTYLMRPPGGNLSGELANYAQKQGYMVTMWSVDTHDYYVSAPLIVDNVLSQVKPGGIVLMHDGGGDRSATVEALPQIISALRSQGYQFVTVPELMERQAQWATLQPPNSTPGIQNPNSSSDTSPVNPPLQQSLPEGNFSAPDAPVMPPRETTLLPNAPDPSVQENGALPDLPSPVIQDIGQIPIEAEAETKPESPSAIAEHL